MWKSPFWRRRTCEHERRAAFLSLMLLKKVGRIAFLLVGNKPGPRRMTPSAPEKLHGVRSDINILAKFVMDSLNGLLHVDDV